MNKRQKKKFYNKFNFKTYKRSKKYKFLRDLVCGCVNCVGVSNQITPHALEIDIKFQVVILDSDEVKQKADMFMKQYEMIRSQYEKGFNGIN